MRFFVLLSAFLCLLLKFFRFCVYIARFFC
nr:MAG TPA: hypothetical protein [Caudoviricetes sp.]